MSDGILTYEALVNAMKIINKETEWCKHEATIQIEEYLWVCDCHRKTFIKSSPELRQWYKEWINTTPSDDWEEVECFGIKVLRRKT